MKAARWEVLNKNVYSSPRLNRGSQFTVENIVDILLENRGIKTEQQRKEFLNPRLENVNLKNTEIDSDQVKKTIKRIEQAIKNNEKIIIYGDYDVDGICGTAILWETIYSFYKNVEPYIPHRVEEGYGLSIAGIKNLQLKIKNNNDEAGLIITVDNGIVANEAVEFAGKNNIDVIITDHHVESKKMPTAYSIIHTTKLCGAGVAYLLAQELNYELRIKNYERNEHLELVVLATVADLVPLTGSNRALVKVGLEALKKTKRPGLLALFNAAQIKAEEINVYKIGHVIAPRLNAAGRITHAMDSLRLLCTKDANRAAILAENLNETNKDRQTLTFESTAHADLITEFKDKIIFVSDSEYNQGIIGLVASRLVEKYYKPSIVVSIGDKYSKGSARSIPGFNIIDFLRQHSQYFVDAGGHPMAAGFTIETLRIEEFKKALVESSTSAITDEMLERVLKIDCEMALENISNDLLNSMQQLSPFGMGNPEPLFVSKKIKVEGVRFVGKDSKHLKIQLSQNGKTFDGIFFGGGESGLKNGDSIDIAYSLENNSWNGQDRLQLKIKDIKQD